MRKQAFALKTADMSVNRECHLLYGRGHVFLVADGNAKGGAWSFALF